MTDAPKLFRDMTDVEKGLLMLADHRGEVLQGTLRTGDGTRWLAWAECHSPCWDDGTAYRVKPKAPPVETFTSKVQLWDDDDVTRIYYAHADGTGKISNITHTYTITDGRVTACDTIIHD